MKKDRHDIANKLWMTKFSLNEKCNLDSLHCMGGGEMEIKRESVCIGTRTRTQKGKWLWLRCERARI